VHGAIEVLKLDVARAWIRAAAAHNGPISRVPIKPLRMRPCARCQCPKLSRDRSDDRLPLAN
jgi:hypothetical protein